MSGETLGFHIWTINRYQTLLFETKSRSPSILNFQSGFKTPFYFLVENFRFQNRDLHETFRHVGGPHRKRPGRNGNVAERGARKRMVECGTRCVSGARTLGFSYLAYGFFLFFSFFFINWKRPGSGERQPESAVARRQQHQRLTARSCERRRFRGLFFLVDFIFSVGFVSSRSAFHEEDIKTERSGGDDSVAELSDPTFRLFCVSFCCYCCLCRWLPCRRAVASPGEAFSGQVGDRAALSRRRCGSNLASVRSGRFVWPSVVKVGPPDSFGKLRAAAAAAAATAAAISLECSEGFLLFSPSTKPVTFRSRSRFTTAATARDQISALHLAFGRFHPISRNCFFLSSPLKKKKKFPLLQRIQRDVKGAGRLAWNG